MNRDGKVIVSLKVGGQLEMKVDRDIKLKGVDKL